MSDSTNETNAIDQKKQNSNSSSNTSSSYVSKITSFLGSFIGVIILILLYFSSSGIILFICKLAQSNILPTELQCSPYTNTSPTINPSPIVTNIFTTFTDIEQSMKLEIPYDINSKNKLIDILREYKEKPSSHFLSNYFISIVESLLQFNYSSITTLMNAMNNSFIEPVIVLFGPLILGIVYLIGTFLNIIYFVYLWFSKMSWFFKTNINDSGNGLPKWEQVSISDPLNWFIGVCLIFLFMTVFFMGFPILSMLPFICYHNVLISLLFYKGTMNHKTITAFSLIAELFKHYKVYIVSIISIMVAMLSFSKLGAIPGILSIVIFGLVYWGTINNDMYKPLIEHNLTPSVSYEQARKICPSNTNVKKKHGFLYNMLIGQNGGENISKDLKKINKLLLSTINT